MNMLNETKKKERKKRGKKGINLIPLTCD